MQQATTNQKLFQTPTSSCQTQYQPNNVYIIKQQNACIN